MQTHYDFIVIGSGFGGSVSALRLSEKGYSVLVIEKGRRWKAEDFPQSNWNLRDWLWAPEIGLSGIMKMTFFPHVTILSGVGVGGGSLVYANTLPIPESEFFEQGSWAGLADWWEELQPHYATARRMLGAEPVPFETVTDRAMAEIGEEIGRGEHYHPTTVAVFFGEPGVEVDDPYFDGEGPKRTGCIQCGGCMLGCRHDAKNTLDKNYLYLAEKKGVEVLPETLVTAVRPRTGGGYTVQTQHARRWIRRNKRAFTADNVVFAGGVLGTVDLLLDMKADADGLPNLSPRTGQMVRTNSESLINVISADRQTDLSRGVAIGSILHTDDHSHVEPVRYAAGQANAYRPLLAPHAPGDNLFQRLRSAARWAAKDPRKTLRVLTTPDLAKNSVVLLYMRTIEGTMSLVKGLGGLTTKLEPGVPAPQAFMKEATDIADRMADKLDGLAVGLAPEFVFGTATTAHILGGACIGATPDDGVIDAQHRVHGYPGLFVCDGSAVSANPGVNPSLTITAMTERAMTHIPKKGHDAAR